MILPEQHPHRLSRIFQQLRDVLHGSSGYKRRKAHLKHCDLCHLEAHNGSSRLPQIEKCEESANAAANASFKTVQARPPSVQQFRALFSITGMTCSACVPFITEALEAKPCVRTANVVLLANSAIVEFVGEHHLEKLVQAIEELGYGAVVEDVKSILQQQSGSGKPQAPFWKGSFSVEGIKDTSCLSMVTKALERESRVRKVDISLLDNSITIEFEDKKYISEILTVIGTTGTQVFAI